MARALSSIARGSLLALIVAACAGSGFQYVEVAGDTLFKLPEGWTLYEQDETSGVSSGDGREQITAFDGAPEPSAEHILDPESSFPAGYAKVHVLTDEERDAYSFAALRNEELPIDRLVQQDDVRIVRNEEIERDGGFRGFRTVLEIQTQGRSLMIDQNGLLDSDTRVAYLFLIGCESDCYSENQNLIDEIVTSWTIKES